MEALQPENTDASALCWIEGKLGRVADQARKGPGDLLQRQGWTEDWRDRQHR